MNGFSVRKCNSSVDDAGWSVLSGAAELCPVRDAAIGETSADCAKKS